jgi:hypothetical protein
MTINGHILHDVTLMFRSASVMSSNSSSVLSSVAALAKIYESAEAVVKKYKLRVLASMIQTSEAVGNINQLEVGDHIAIYRASMSPVAIWHHGYVWSKEIVKGTTYFDILHFSGSIQESPEVKLDSIETFLAKDTLLRRIIKYVDPDGNQVELLPSEDSREIARALRECGGKGCYHLLACNCENVVTFIKTGHNIVSNQVSLVKVTLDAELQQLKKETR